MPQAGLFRDKSRVKTTIILVKSIPAFLLFVSIFSFYKEFTGTIGYIFGIFGALFFKQPIPGLTREISNDIWVFTFIFIFDFFLFFFLWLWLVSSQALLPVQTFSERLQTALHLLLYIFGLHGPAVFIKDGQIQADYKELTRKSPGVVVIDYNSAVVIEKKIRQPSCVELVAGFLITAIDFLRPVSKQIESKNQFEATRVCGPGVTFTSYDERIRGVGDLADTDHFENVCGAVDLRIQFRINERQLDSSTEKIRARVHGYTRDGIELTTNVWALFTIGQDPEPYALQVTYIGEHIPENLRVVNIDDKNTGVLKIISLEDTLDAEDQKEIHKYAVEHSPKATDTYADLSKPADTPVFNSSRVFSAVFSRARTKDDRVIPWNDLPTRVAIDYFRELLSTIPCEQLYQPVSSDQLQADILRDNLRAKMRNQSLLSFRLVYHSSGANLVAGNRYSRNQVRVTGVQSLTNPKVLRDRGIRLITCGFGDLIPVSDTVYKQRLDSWRASWQSETVETRAGFDAEVIRIHNHARVQAQRELTQCFSQILQNPNISQDVLAIRIFQALEALATEPTTRQLLPGDTINLMRTIHDWLLPGDPGLPPGLH